MMYEEEIKPYREEIDRLNTEILEKLAQRQQAALMIGSIKKKHGKQVRDPKREEAILERISQQATQYKMEPAALRRVFKEIIRLCVEAEEQQ